MLITNNCKGTTFSRKNLRNWCKNALVAKVSAEVGKIPAHPRYFQ